MWNTVTFRPTPCPAWDLEALLGHMCDGMAAFEQGLANGAIEFTVPGESDRGNPITIFEQQATTLLDAVATSRPGLDHPLAAIGNQSIPRELLAAAVDRDCSPQLGRRHRLPTTRSDPGAKDWPSISCRSSQSSCPQHCELGLFSTPVTAGGAASPSDRLVGLLGRSPVRRPAMGHGRPCPNVPTQQSTGQTR